MQEGPCSQSTPQGLAPNLPRIQQPAVQKTRTEAKLQSAAGLISNATEGRDPVTCWPRTICLVMLALPATEI